MMNPEIKTRWVAWLRANADKQSQGRLQRVTDIGDSLRAGFCCLGGLCELAVEDGIIERKLCTDPLLDAQMYSYGTNNGGLVPFSWSHTSLPDAVLTWAGLNSSDPRVRVEGYGFQSLTYVNDNIRLNFNQIADLIEEQL